MIQDADAVVDAETGMFPRHQVSGKQVIKYLAVYEQCEDTTTEDFGHRGEVTDGNEEEGSLMVDPPPLKRLGDSAGSSGACLQRSDGRR